MIPQTATKRLTVAKTLQLLLLIAVALFLLTMFLTFQMNTRIHQVLMTDANCTCSCVDRTPNINSKSPNVDIKLPSVCWNDSCRSDYVRLLQREDAHPIPEIRHILWRNESVSEYFAQQLATWQKIHPNWTFVLWRDQDMEPFVAAYFPGMLEKFRSLPDHIMRVDMIRYMLLYKFGGTYADLDYNLVSSLDQFRRLHAVVTVEPEAHSLQTLGLSWPVKPLVNPAFLMSAPGHSFFLFVIQRLEPREAAPNGALSFAGPYGLTDIIESYRSLLPIGNHPSDIVFVPHSYSFFPYKDNRLNNSGSIYLGQRFFMLKDRCKLLMSSNGTAQQQLRRHHQLVQYCSDVNNMDPITDKSQRVVAVHDMQKTGALYDGAGTKFYTKKLRDIRGVMKNLVFGRDFFQKLRW